MTSSKRFGRGFQINDASAQCEIGNWKWSQKQKSVFKFRMIPVAFEEGLVTVIIPAYNREWSLENTVESVFRQTYRPIECIIVDDGSNDGTFAKAKELVSKAPDGIRVICLTKENGGANSARNLGMAHCTGEFVSFLDSDDELLPEAVEDRCKELIAANDVDICYGRASIVDENGIEQRKMNEPWPDAGEARIVPYHFHTNSPMIRRCLCSLAGIWRNDDDHALEYEYFARLKYYARRVVFLDKVLSIYVRHEENKIFDFKSNSCLRSIFRMLFSVKSLILFGPHDNRAERAALAQQFKTLAKQFYDIRDYKNACFALRESLMINWSFKSWCQLHVLKLLSVFGPRVKG